jgi:signal transduction histidine kinase
MLAHKLLPLAALGLNLVLLGSALLPGRKSHRNLIFAWLAAALAVWNLGVLGLRWATDPGHAVAWEQFLHVGVIPIPALFYHYVLAFLDKPRRRADLTMAWALCVVFLALSPTPLFLTGVRETVWGWAPTSGPLYGVFIAYFQIYLVLGLVLLVRAHRSLTSSFKRNRTLLVIVGGTVSVAGGLVDFVRFTLGWEWLYPLGIPANAVFALALGVAIVRYRLVDVSALMKRFVLYLLTSVALAPVLAVGLWAVDQLFATRPGAPSGSGGAADFARDALLLFGMLTIALPLLRRLETGLEHIMFRRRRGVSDALVALSKEMSSLLDVRLLGTTLTEGLVARIPATHAILYLHDTATDAFVGWFDAASVDREASAEPPIDEAVALWLRMTRRTMIVEDAGFQASAYARMRASLQRLEHENVALLVPLVMNGELRAVLALGEKLSGEIFDSGEIELLEMLIGQAAIALANSSLYEDLKAQMDELRRTQEQLVQSAKLAAIGELAASVAHEINNPLMVILGNSGLLLKRAPEGSFEAQRAEAIATEANRAGRIVRELLDFARRREPRREPVAIHPLLDRAIDLLHAKVTVSGVDVQRVYDPTLPPLPADRDQLTQVFVNLIANAVDAMPDGGTLLVQTDAREDDEGRPVLTVSVIDTGVGIPPDRLPKIFEPFYTTKPEGAGTGLGLSVSQGIVKRHGGRIHVDSKPGLGTTLVVTLPLV